MAELEELAEKIKEIVAGKDPELISRKEAKLLKDIFFSVGTVIDSYFTPEEQLKFKFHDEVTQLYRREYFEENIKRLDVSRELPLTIIACFIKDYRVEDVVLRKIADILKSNCRQEDIIARWSKREYNILLPQTDTFQAREILHRIKKDYYQSSIKPSKPTIMLNCGTKETEEQDIENILWEVKETGFY